MTLTTLELCAGAGGQALGLQQAGFHHIALIDIDEHACLTLKHNFPGARVLRMNLLTGFDWSRFKGVDLIAAGLPCPPFSVAGKQLGAADERNLFPAALEVVRVVRPKAVMIENVAGLLSPKFEAYRDFIVSKFGRLGYQVKFRLLNAADFGVPQRRQRVVIVALRNAFAERFRWPKAGLIQPDTVGEALVEHMAENGWRGADRWAEQANTVAPTIVGGSKKHGGPDLGPKGTRNAWSTLGVNGCSIADEAPAQNFQGMPRLTVPMVARLQGFPDDWHFEGRKTHAYRQVGNAFPPPMAAAVARQIKKALVGGLTERTPLRVGTGTDMTIGNRGLFK